MTNPIWYFIIALLVVLIFGLVFIVIFFEDIKNIAAKLRDAIEGKDKVLERTCSIDKDCGDLNTYICDNTVEKCRVKPGVKCSFDTDCSSLASICTGDTGDKICNTTQKAGGVGGIPINGKCNDDTLEVNINGLCTFKSGQICTGDSQCSSAHCGPTGTSGTQKVCSHINAGEICIIQFGIDPCDPDKSLDLSCQAGGDGNSYCQNKKGKGTNGAVCDEGPLDCNTGFICKQLSPYNICVPTGSNQGGGGDKCSTQFGHDTCTAPLKCLGGVCVYDFDVQCNSNSDCLKDHVCDTSDHTCVADDRQPCFKNNQCVSNNCSDIFTIYQFKDGSWTNISTPSFTTIPNRLSTSLNKIKNEDGNFLDIITMAFQDTNDIQLGQTISGTTSFIFVKSPIIPSGLPIENKREIIISRDTDVYAVYGTTPIASIYFFKHTSLDNYIKGEQIDTSLINSVTLNMVLDFTLDVISKTILSSDIIFLYNTPPGDNTSGSKDFKIDKLNENVNRRAYKKSRSHISDGDIHYVLISTLIDVQIALIGKKNVIIIGLFPTSSSTAIITSIDDSDNDYNTFASAKMIRIIPTELKNVFGLLILSEASTDITLYKINITELMVNNNAVLKVGTDVTKVKDNIPFSYLDKVNYINVDKSTTSLPVKVAFVGDVVGNEIRTSTVSMTVNTVFPNYSSTNLIIPGNINESSIADIADDGTINMINLGTCIDTT